MSDEPSGEGGVSRDREGEGSPVARALREPGTLQRVVCATLAWSITVAPAALARSSSTLARIAALLAVLAAVSGPAIATRHRRIGRHLGISAFLALSLGVWLSSPQSVEPARIDAIRAAIGAVAWGIYALSWGEPWTAFGAPAQRVENDPFAAPLRARATLAPYAVPIATLGVAASLVMLLGVWQIRDTSRALIGQAAAVGAAVAVITAGATVAVSRGKDRPKDEKRVTPSFVRALVLLAIAAVVGAVGLALRT
jgi:hypothetical protein